MDKVIMKFMPSWVEHNLYTPKGEKYSIIHIPENTMVNGEDCGDLCMYVMNKMDDKTITPTMNAVFKHGSVIKLAKDGKKVKTVKVEDLAEGLDNLYRNRNLGIINVDEKER